MSLYFKMFAGCQIVKGFTRSIIYDLQRGKFDFVPNELADILQMQNNSSKNDILEFYGPDNAETINEYFDFLTVNEYGFWCQSKNEHDLFPDIDLQWDSPSIVTNAILDWSDESSYSFEKVFFQLESLGCKDVQLRVFSKVSLSFFGNVLDLLIKSRIKSVSIITKYTDDISEGQYLDLLRRHLRVNEIIVYGHEDKKINTGLPYTHLQYVSDTINHSSHCGIVHPNYFSVNLEMFTESNLYNSCLNRKISICSDGTIKNCPSMNESYGHVNNMPLEQVAQTTKFREIWSINKNQINVCKDCEFRHMCTDCRAFIADVTDSYSKPLRCKYDPYTATWH
ncbi:MAG TPA: grasp-with-spasm system SPASM domain peptide maturase [Chryseosolibacter sp.]